MDKNYTDILTLRNNFIEVRDTLCIMSMSCVYMLQDDYEAKIPKYSKKISPRKKAMELLTFALDPIDKIIDYLNWLLYTPVMDSPARIGLIRELIKDFNSREVEFYRYFVKACRFTKLDEVEVIAEYYGLYYSYSRSNTCVQISNINYKFKESRNYYMLRTMIDGSGIGKYYLDPEKISNILLISNSI